MSPRPPAPLLTIEALVARHLARYPAMAVADVYKLLHQGTMGTQDTAAHPDILHRRLRVEFERADAASEGPITEAVSRDGAYVRIHLGPAKQQKFTPEQIFQAMQRSRERFVPDLSAFLALWLSFRETLAARLGFDAGDVEDFAERVSARGYPPMPHSRRYLDLYRPSYRLAYLEYLPASIVP